MSMVSKIFFNTGKRICCSCLLLSVSIVIFPKFVVGATVDLLGLHFKFSPSIHVALEYNST